MARLQRLAPLAGVVYVALIVAALLGPSSPDVTDSPAKVVSFYLNHRGYEMASIFFLGIGAVFAVTFFAVLTGYLRSRGATLTAAVVFGGSLILATAMSLAASLNLALTDHTRRLSPGAAQALNYLQDDGFAVVLFIGVAITMAGAGFAILQTRALPVWLGWVALVAALASVTAIASWPAFLLSGLWTLVVAGILTRRSLRAAPTEPASGAEVPAPRTTIDVTGTPTAAG